jgi:WD40 repeat protein
MSLRLRALAVAVPLVLLGAGLAVAEPPPGDRPRTDLYGDPLPDGAVARLGTAHWRYSAAVRGLVFSPDGKTIAAVSGRIPRLCDAATGKELRRFVGHESTADCVLFFPDGKTLVTAGADGTICLWDVATGKELRRIVNPSSGKAVAGVMALALAPDGKRLASGGRNGDQNIYLWETASGKLLRSWPAHAADVWVLAFSPDGKTLVSGGESNGQLINGTFVSRPNDTYGAAAWDPATGKKRYEIGHLVRVAVRETPGDKNDDDEDRRERKRNPRPPRYENRTDPERVAALAFSPDGKLLATGGYDPPHQCWTVRLWDSATGKERRLDDAKSDAKAIAFSPDGKLLTAQDEQDLVFWDVGRGTRLNPRPDALVPGGPPGGIKMEPLEKVPLEKLPAARLTPGLPGDPLPAPRRPGVLPPTVGFSGVWSLAFSPDGRTLAAGLADGDVKLWDVARGTAGKPRLTERFEPRGHQRPINTIAVSPDGRLAFTGEEGPGGRLWEVATGKEIRTFEGGWWYVRCAAFSPDGKMVATGHRIGPIYLWDTATGKRLRRLDGHTHEVVSVSFTGDGKTLVSHGVGSDLIFWDASTGKEIRRLDDRPKGFGLRPALSPDGRWIATTAGLGDAHGLYLWDAATGAERRHFPAGDDQAGAFSPDGLVIASVGEQVKLWDVAAGQEIGRLQGGLHPYHIYYDAPVAFSPDGRFLAAAEIVEGQTGAHLWSVESGKDSRIDGGQGKVTAIAFSPDGRYFLTAGEDRNVLVWDVARVSGEPEKPAPLNGEQVRELVADLRGNSPLRAFQAFRRLSRSPEQVVAVLRERLRPVAPADPERLARLVRRLDSDDFKDREEATAALRELGQPAERGLKEALAAERSAEVRKRIGRLLEEMEQARKGRRTDWSVRLLERIGTAEARTLLEALARGADGAPPTEDAAAALRRLDKPSRPAP